LNPVTLDILDCVNDTEALEMPGAIDVITGLSGTVEGTGAEIFTFTSFDTFDDPHEFTANSWK